jgi:hypothetical protein
VTLDAYDDELNDPEADDQSRACLEQSASVLELIRMEGDSVVIKTEMPRCYPLPMLNFLKEFVVNEDESDDVPEYNQAVDDSYGEANPCSEVDIGCEKEHNCNGWPCKAKPKRSLCNFVSHVSKQYLPSEGTDD